MSRKPIQGFEVHRKIDGEWIAIEVYTGHRARSKARHAIFLYRSTYSGHEFKLVTKFGEPIYGAATQG